MNDAVVNDGAQLDVVFDKAKHIYKVREGDGEYVPVPSVTTILKVLNKPALLYWVGNEAANYIRENIVPGEPLDEVDIEDLAAKASRAFVFAQRRAATAG